MPSPAILSDIGPKPALTAYNAALKARWRHSQQHLRELGVFVMDVFLWVAGLINQNRMFHAGAQEALHQLPALGVATEIRAMILEFPHPYIRTRHIQETLEEAIGVLKNP